MLPHQLFDLMKKFNTSIYILQCNRIIKHYCADPEKSKTLSLVFEIIFQTNTTSLLFLRC